MAEPVQVKTELTLDNKASDTLESLRSDFVTLQADVAKSQSLTSDFGKQFLATFAAINIKPFLSGVRQAVTDFIEVGAAASEAERGVTAMLVGMSGREWATTAAYARDLNSQLTETAITTGRLKSELADGHKALVTFLGGTSQAFAIADKNITNIAKLSKMGVPIQELATQFGKMASGFVSMESPVFNLLKSTGIFSSDITKVNAEWQKLTNAERIKRLEGAFEKVAANLDSAPKSLSELNNSYQQIQKEFAGTFGKAAMGEFMGPLGDLVDELGDTRGELKGFARELGKTVGEFAVDAIGQMKEGLQYVREHSNDIKKAVRDGFTYARETIAWIIGHRNELMMIGGAFAVGRTGAGMSVVKGVAGIAGGMVGSGANMLANREVSKASGGLLGGLNAEATSTTTTMGKLAGSLGTVMKSGDAAIKTGAKVGSSMMSLFTSIAAGGPPVWAATAAIGALAGAAIYLNKKINDAENERNKVIERNVEEFTKLTHKMGSLTKAELSRLDELRNQAERMAGDKLVKERVGDKFDAAWKAREENILKAYVHPMEKIDEAIQRYATKAEDEGLFPEELGAQRMAITAAARLYETAWKAHDDGAMKYIANMIGSSKAMKEAFLTSAEMTSEGFMSFAETVKGLGTYFSREFGGQVENIGRAQMEAEAKKANPTVNFNGGQVFKIQQDFREQDPDKIAVSFMKTITKAAVSRVQAVTSTPFAT